MNFKTLYIILLAFVLFSCNESADKEKDFVIEGCNENMDSVIESITFPSLDSLLITAEIYCNNKDAEVLVLCHQAGYSRGEYKETAQKLYEMGFNCFVIDQRSGDEVNGIKNLTAKRAKSKNLPMEYLDAEKDIVAAVSYASQFYGKKVILVGSSYSASLVLKIAAENEHVEKVISFSPGEYFGDQLKLTESISNLNMPVFITSSKKEAEATTEIFNAIPSELKVQFIPEGEGEHGSKALWSSKKDHEEYWTALMKFFGE